MSILNNTINFLLYTYFFISDFENIYIIIMYRYNEIHEINLQLDLQCIIYL